MNAREVLTPGMMAMSVAMYFPTFKRIFARHTTGDFSKATQLCIVILQAASLWLATLEHAWYLFCYYILQLGLTSSLLYLIYKYYEGEKDG